MTTKFYKGTTRKKYKPNYTLSLEVQLLSELLGIKSPIAKGLYCALTKPFQVTWLLLH